MYVFGLTGGISSGKSAVSSLLDEMGCPIVDADLLARQVVEPGKPALKLIVKHFGDDVLQPDGTLNRAKLSGIVFKDEAKRQTLNECTHPYIQKAMRWELLKYFLKGEAMVVLVTPLLYESGGKYIKWLKRIVVVNCSHEQQVERLQKRDSLSEEEALQRIRAQMPLEEKCRKADLVLDNSGGIGLLENLVKDLYAELNRITYDQRMLRAFLVFLITGVVLYGEHEIERELSLYNLNLRYREMADVIVFLICLLDALIMLVLNVYLIILLSDLDCDFLNTKQGCKRLNNWVMPELIGTVIIPVVLILTFHWFLFILFAPLSGFLIYRHVTLPAGSIGVYDPTEIRNRGMLARFQKEAFVKIGYHLITFFVSLYCFIVALLIG